jgi:hypothetical protein
MSEEWFDPSKFVYRITHPTGRKELLDDIRSMSGAHNFDAYDNEENRTIVFQEFSARFGAEISLSDAQKIYAILHNTNRIISTKDREAQKLAELEAARAEEVVDETPQPSEFETFYKTRSSREIRERISRDQNFAKFAKAQIADESSYADGVRTQFYWPVFKTQAATSEAAAAFVEQDTNGLVLYDRTWPILETNDQFRVPVVRRDGGPALSICDVHPALNKFAQQYTSTPSSKLRPVMGYVTLSDGTRYDVQKFNQLVAEATAAKLI